MTEIVLEKISKIEERFDFHDDWSQILREARLYVQGEDGCLVEVIRITKLEGKDLYFLQLVDGEILYRPDQTPLTMIRPPAKPWEIDGKVVWPLPSPHKDDRRIR